MTVKKITLKVIEELYLMKYALISLPYLKIEKELKRLRKLNLFKKLFLIRLLNLYPLI